MTRWVSHTPSGQEFWQVLAQWMWNMRLELGHRLHPTPIRTTEFAQAEDPPPAVSIPDTPPSVIYGPPEWARTAREGSFSGTDGHRHRWMAHCSAQQIIHSMHKSGEQSKMAQYVSSTPRGSLIAVGVYCENSVRGTEKRARTLAG